MPTEVILMFAGKAEGLPRVEHMKGADSGRLLPYSQILD